MHVRLRIVTVLAALVTLGSAAAAQPTAAPPPPPPPPPGGGYVYTPPPGPVRSGFTGELDLGLGFTRIAADGFESETKAGLAGLNFQLGGFVSPQLAISVRLSGTQFTPEGSGVRFVNGMLGLVAQYWVAPKLFVGGGVGYSVFVATSESTGDQDGVSGYAINGRAGYDVWQGRSSAFQVALEITPGIYDDGTVTSTALQLAWQHY